MSNPEGPWRVSCSQKKFDECKKDEKFPFIVALARAVNAMNFVHSAMLVAGDKPDPESQRGRINSYFFASALLYEILSLIRSMGKAFKDDAEYQNGLRLMLKDKTAQRVEQMHLNPVRNRAVFHFLPEYFGSTIENATCNNCDFVYGLGNKRKDLYYPFADIIAAEILVGFSSDNEQFYQALGQAMADTRDLVIRFTDQAELFIAHYVKRWGFDALSDLP